MMKLMTLGVEHFYPKSCTLEHGHNYHLDWRNLLEFAMVAVSHMYLMLNGVIRRRSDRSCDVPKGTKKFLLQILNPLRIPRKKYAYYVMRSIREKNICR